MSTRHTTTRRAFLERTAAAAVATTVPYWLTSRISDAQETTSANDRPHVGVIGVGGEGMAIAQAAAALGDIVAVCDVDQKHAEKAKEAFGGKPDTYGDYRELLDRKDIDVVLNATPDHWHTIINVAACKAGKDVYAEKPLTLTIDEGKILCRVVEQTGRVVQVGTQQRSEKAFQTAVELVRNGRLGKLKEVTVTLPYYTTAGGPFAAQGVPAELNWDVYQGQAPEHDYCFERTHWGPHQGGWRWWYEYAGGIITDWGNHHMDIAHWGMDVETSGPLTIEGTATFPNAGRPNCYSTPDRFEIHMTYPGGIPLLYEGVADSRNGIMFVGDKGRVFVNRGGVNGKPVEELADNPLPDNAWRARPSDNHMANFFDCVKTRGKPVSPVDIQHRTVSACHLANLAVRLQRKLTWDPQTQRMIGDEEANSWQQRPQRKPYVLEA
jgi:myo-inositol 2-dehydrogenase/D-chiro-inositol 1-dehydrogenase